MAYSKKLSFSKSPIIKMFLWKFHGLVLGLVGLIDAKKWYLIWKPLVFFKMKQNQKKVFWKKILNGRLKKRSFSSSVNSQYFFVKIWWIAPWDWCEGHWCSSNYMDVRLSDVSAKTALKHKKCIFACFWAYGEQPHAHIGWATSLPFASINYIYPRTNPCNFHKKCLRIGDF